MAEDKREQAKALFIKGVAIAEIARRGIASRRTIQRWMDADRKAGNDWEALRSSLPEPEPPQRPKVVTFERPRGGGEAAPVRVGGAFPEGNRPSLTPSDYGTVEGLLVVLDEAIAMARVEVMAPAIPQNFGAAINGLCKLIEQRQKIAPLDDEALLGLLLTRYKSPKALVEALKGAGWQRSA